MPSSNPAAAAAQASQDERIDGLPVLPAGTDRATLRIPVFNPATNKTEQTSLVAGDGATTSNQVVGGPKFVRYRSSQLYGVPASASTLDRLTPATIVPGTLATVDNPADTPLTVTKPPQQYLATLVAAGTAGSVLVPRYIGAAASNTVPVVWTQVAAPGYAGAGVRRYTSVISDWKADETMKIAFGASDAFFSAIAAGGPFAAPSQAGVATPNWRPAAVPGTAAGSTSFNATFTAVKGGEQTITVPGALSFSGVGVRTDPDPATGLSDGRQDVFFPESGYISAPDTLTILANVGIVAGNVICFSYVTGPVQPGNPGGPGFDPHDPTFTGTVSILGEANKTPLKIIDAAGHELDVDGQAIAASDNFYFNAKGSSVTFQAGGVDVFQATAFGAYSKQKLVAETGAEISHGLRLVPGPLIAGPGLLNGQLEATSTGLYFTRNNLRVRLAETPATTERHVWHVENRGQAFNEGDGSPTNPYANLDYASFYAKPGDTLEVHGVLSDPTLSYQLPAGVCLSLRAGCALTLESVTVNDGSSIVGQGQLTGIIGVPASVATFRGSGFVFFGYVTAYAYGGGPLGTLPFDNLRWMVPPALVSGAQVAALNVQYGNGGFYHAHRQVVLRNCSVSAPGNIARFYDEIYSQNPAFVAGDTVAKANNLLHLENNTLVAPAGAQVLDDSQGQVRLERGNNLYQGGLAVPAQADAVVLTSDNAAPGSPTPGTGSGIDYANPVLHSTAVTLTVADCGKHHVMQGQGVALWQVGLPDPATCKYQLISIQIGNSASGLWALQSTDIDGQPERRMWARETALLWSAGAAGWRKLSGRTIPFRAKLTGDGSGDYVLGGGVQAVRLPVVASDASGLLTATPGQFTFPRAGTYEVSATVLNHIDAATSEIDLFLAFNGNHTHPQTIVDFKAAPAGYIRSSLQGSFEAVAGDFIQPLQYGDGVSLTVHNRTSAPAYKAVSEVTERPIW